MPRVSLAFFTVGALCGLVGMLWGMQMGMTQDFTMHPAHAHLNLLGWVTLSIMGGFYALAGERASTRLAWVNFVLSTFGVIAMTALLPPLLAGDASKGPLMPIAEIPLVLGMLTFILALIGVWRKPAA